MKIDKKSAAAVIVLVVIVSAYYLLSPGKNTARELVKQVVENASSKCSGLEGKELEQCLSQADEEITNIAVEYNDPSVCENTSITNVEGIGRQECYTRVAIALKNASICSLIGEVSLEDACYERTAIETRNYSACSLSSDEYSRDECYSSYASVTGDKNACGFIVDELSREQCYSL